MRALLTFVFSALLLVAGCAASTSADGCIKSAEILRKGGNPLKPDAPDPPKEAPKQEPDR